MCIRGSRVGIQNPTHRKLIGRSMTAPQTVLSPSNILSPTAHHLAYNPAQNFGVFKK
jgi:hypothetical protein